MNKPRLELFTDAIMAIAATIMVLELRVPKITSLSDLTSLWSVFLAYLVSFVLIYVVWYSHYKIFQKAKVISTATYAWNGVWLFFMTLTPFTTAWIGEFSNSMLPEITYSIILLLWSISFQLMNRQVRKDNPEMQKDPTSSLKFRLPLYGGILAALVVSFLVPILTLIIVGITTMSLAIPMMRGRHI
ncbi:TMEM175 family protein [Lentilactobacillus kefiri]|uniref:Integral membrane protein n=2 Tax=Lentilactobacillus kefiri TaxID=33962 RepID=A0A8E1RIX2_LENKE|nr:TMEM175 family protein [Lentilactobacillus kefiri]KRL51983.1 integral membrane protein [Lentilactobacillus parakefiri DSM 10551]MDF4143248.1 TMEM175 family protein [Lactobacillus kefiranofaciens]KRM52412.1 integral membrane protein [Lentilactobacillus kefiri DSM 20587 = JCM 5818]MCJ2161250.1 TMEM175 family protein [Lentilactobacillus kefiri]MCP9368733.1 DUF1211 domain-containing protein [Lentilactobacillus kefiri]